MGSYFKGKGAALATFAAGVIAGVVLRGRRDGGGITYDYDVYDEDDDDDEDGYDAVATVVSELLGAFLGVAPDEEDDAL